MQKKDNYKDYRKEENGKWYIHVLNQRTKELDWIEVNQEKSTLPVEDGDLNGIQWEYMGYYDE